MFRRVEKSLPKDPAYPSDLKQLGYFITPSDHIRKIADHSKGFVYFYTTDERHNDVRREAYHQCIRAEVIRRLVEDGLVQTYTPQFTTVKPEEPSIPILMSDPATFKNKKRILVIANEDRQDLGIWSYRSLDNEGGLRHGSAIGLMDGIKERMPDIGVVILNPGQLYYSYKEKRAMTHASWQAMPRKNALSDMTPILEANLIQGIRTPEDHIKRVLERLVKDPELVHAEAEIYLIGLCSGATALVSILDENWASYSRRVQALALVQPVYYSEHFKSRAFKTFLKYRARCWEPLEDGRGTDKVIATPFKPHSVVSKSNRPTAGSLPSIEPTWFSEQDASGSSESETDAQERDVHKEPAERSKAVMPTFSGATNIAEMIFPTIYPMVLEFFAEVAVNAATYRNPNFSVDPIPEVTEEKHTEGQENGDKEKPERIKTEQVSLAEPLPLPEGVITEKDMDLEEKVEKMPLRDLPKGTIPLPVAREGIISTPDVKAHDAKTGFEQRAESVMDDLETHKKKHEKHPEIGSISSVIIGDQKMSASRGLNMDARKFAGGLVPVDALRSAGLADFVEDPPELSLDSEVREQDKGKQRKEETADQKVKERNNKNCGEDDCKNTEEITKAENGVIDYAELKKELDSPRSTHFSPGLPSLIPKPLDVRKRATSASSSRLVSPISVDAARTIRSSSTSPVSTPTKTRNQRSSPSERVQALQKFYETLSESKSPQASPSPKSKELVKENQKPEKPEFGSTSPSTREIDPLNYKATYIAREFKEYCDRAAKEQFHRKLHNSGQEKLTIMEKLVGVGKEEPAIDTGDEADDEGSGKKRVLSLGASYLSGPAHPIKRAKKDVEGQPGSEHQADPNVTEAADDTRDISTEALESGMSKQESDDETKVGSATESSGTAEPSDDGGVQFSGTSLPTREKENREREMKDTVLARDAEALEASKVNGQSKGTVEN